MCVSLAASVLVAVQIVLIIARGEAFCLDEGCRIVEGLTRVPPVMFNLLGLAYFQAIFWMAVLERKGVNVFSLLRLLLTGGLAAEGVFLGFQSFAAQTFCLYCLCILAAVLCLNFLAGLRQGGLGIAVLAAVTAGFALLRFDTGGLPSGLTLNDGTYAVRTCSDPAERVYLIFAEDCPHCHRVIEALEGCSRCEFHFNPVRRIDSALLPGLTPISPYYPEINVAALTLLGIHSIPVLIVEHHDRWTFIKGEQNITRFIENICFSGTGGLEFDSTPAPWDEGGCDFDETCE